jgi:hypothetical protein
LALMKAAKEDPQAPLGDLVAKGLVPEEKVYEVPEDLQQTLKMT